MKNLRNGTWGLLGMATAAWFAVGVLCGASAAEGMPGAKSRPNVIFVLSDDQGSVDVNCYGSLDLATPNLNALAQRGVRFTQFYSAAPVCSPSRAAVLTGRYPQRAGVPGNVSSTRGDPGMPAEQVTIAEMLKQAGYATAHVGKWHLGYSPETMPNGQGFDYSFGHMGGCIDNYSHFFYWQGPNRHDLWRNGREVWRDGRNFAELMVEEASEFVEKNKDRPFFVYFAINMPHYPYQGYERWLKHYENLPYPRKLYAAFLSTLDENLGRLLEKVDSLGLRERTIVIFQSDNGHSTEERAHFGGGSAGVYRGAKFSLFEGGIRLPAMISWPGVLPEQQVRDQLCTACDWMPTIAELCGATLPAHKLDGKSMVEVIHSPSAASAHKVFHWQTGPAKNPAWAVREGAWKLLGNANDTASQTKLDEEDRLFLANVAEDPGEKTNRAKEQTELVARLKGLHDAWAKEVAREVARQ